MAQVRYAAKARRHTCARVGINKLNIEKTKLETELGKPENYSDKNSFLQLEQAYKTSQQKNSTANKEYKILFEKIMLLETV